MSSTAGPEVSAPGASDTTLKKRALSTPEVLAQSVANMTPSAAKAPLPLLVFASAGDALWLSFALGLLLNAGRRPLRGPPRRRRCPPAGGRTDEAADHSGTYQMDTSPIFPLRGAVSVTCSLFRHGVAEGRQ
jgi:hypothetical protein